MKVDLSESETGSEEDATGRPVAHKTAAGKPYAPSTSDHPRNPKAEKIEWSHNLKVSPATIHQADAVLSIIKKIYEREHDDPRDDLDVNAAVWGICLNTTLRAAVHLGQDYKVNLLCVKNHLWNSVEQLFNETGTLISKIRQKSLV